MLSETTIIPADIKSELSEFVTQAQIDCSENLVAVYLYGGIAKEEFDANYSDINILIVLQKTDIGSLDILNKALEKPLYKIALNPFILSADELENAANLFPVKFLDIKRNHNLLYGKDVLLTFQINEELLKRNCRRELKNILFRLNHIYIRNHASEEVLGNKMKQILPSLLIHLNILGYIKNGQLYKNKEEIIEHISPLFTLDKSLLLELYHFKKGEQSILNTDMKKCYGNFMALVKELSTNADSL
ncbi:MAG TPA: hypothetical protein VNW06_08045 [Cytophagaceae bacterium]|jgi:hypothetical protein|nr:hypothetical protein [Cytophagaceae bacterium]